MSLPDLLTEADFLVREFPAPANPHRPLVILAPQPGEDAAIVADLTRRIARSGYGGIVIDPAGFGLQFLGEAWFNLVGLYIEACRLTGLFVWLLDGFTNAASLAGLLDEAIPCWRGLEITTHKVQVTGTERIGLTFAEPESSRLLGVLAHSLDAPQPPINLITRLSGNVLQWDPPPGRWEITSLWAAPSPDRPARAFNWLDNAAISSWLDIGFAPYKERLGSQLGRTVQGFLILCPTWPSRRSHEDPVGWPLLTPGDPAWSDLAGLVLTGAVSQSYLTRAATALNRSYLAPLREWCWRHRLRIAGYRLGGEVIPGTTACFDLGGLPDLECGAVPDLVEIAGLAGLARSCRQERTVCQVQLTGEMIRERAEISRLAAAGADFYLVRTPAWLPPDCALALNDYAARVSMAVSAGSPAAETILAIGEGPDTLRAAGRQVLALSARGIEAISPLAGDVANQPELGTRSQLAATALDGPAADREIALPNRFSLRARKVESWTLFTLFNLDHDRWRGPIWLPGRGAVETWHPSTGEQRTVPAIAANHGLRFPLALEPGEAVVAIVRQPGLTGLSVQSQLIRAHLTLSRSWRFEAPGGNILPLSWREQSPGNWAASFNVIALPRDLRLEGLPDDGSVRLNGGLPSCAAGAAICLGHVRNGENIIEIQGARAVPTARLEGDFVCRGGAIAGPPEEIAGPWTLNGYPFLAGPGIYRQIVSVPPELIRPDLALWLEITTLSESAGIRLNGGFMGFMPWPPYRLDLGLATSLLPGENLLEIEVFAPATKSAWAFKGLLGEVSLLFGEVSVPETGAADSLHRLLEEV